MDLLTAYRTLIAVAKERKTEHLHFIEPRENGTEADEYRFTVQHAGTGAWDWDELLDDTYAGPEDIPPHRKAVTNDQAAS
jgi:hypothetical protein